MLLLGTETSWGWEGGDAKKKDHMLRATKPRDMYAEHPLLSFRMVWFHKCSVDGAPGVMRSPLGQMIGL